MSEMRPSANPTPKPPPAAAGNSTRADGVADDPPPAEDEPAHADARRVLEVSSPLNVLVGFSSLLADLGHDLPPDVRHRYATRVREAADTLQRMMGGLVRALDGKALDLGEDWGSSGTFRVAARAREVADRPSEAPAPMPVESLDAGGAGRPRVFIVDGDETNRELLAEFLGGRGYDLVLLASGDEAVMRAEECPPDIVLIDPLMPDEDGFQVARALKGSRGGGFVPLVFVTALVDDDSRIRALDVGAEQLVAKPVNRHELRASVKNLLDLGAKQEALAAQNAQLRSLQRFKEETTAMLVHDLKSPLSAMMMNLDFALDDLSPDPATGDVRTALAESRAAGAKLFRMIANLLDIARSDDGRLVPKRAAVDIAALFERVANEHAAEALARKVAVSTKVELDAPISADGDILGRVLANLVENALRYTHAGGHIGLGARWVTSNGVELLELTVTNDGRPIAAEWRPFVFDKYVQTASSQTTNRGLGLYFSRVAAEAHGGRIELVCDESSTCFRIELPQSPTTGL
jgi:signal transduction histidine kinase